MYGVLEKHDSKEIISSLPTPQISWSDGKPKTFDIAFLRSLCDVDGYL